MNGPQLRAGYWANNFLRRARRRITVSQRQIIDDGSDERSERTAVEKHSRDDYSPPAWAIFDP